ncbi:LysR family transcriptional regulator [Roseobacter sp. WL0113]|uniref:LysR family transcriptional regulator n=2 Tax=Roseobacter sinensis TaxID=2931391 RepID=A0ABT3B996_9RHOB|nr:LysR family transcriptional regulator [Roseobacter sp. WL0113]
MEVFRSRSISAAARALGLTQPAVSGHIASLEGQVGRALFVRQPRGVSPTPFAEDLALQIGDSLDRAEEALARARARSAHISGVVHVAGPAELMAERVAPALKSLQDAGLDIRLQLGGKTSIYRQLIAGEVDLAFTASTPDHPQLAFAVVGSERLIAVAAPDIADRISSAPDLLAALTAERLLSYDMDRPLVRGWLEQNRLPLAGFVPAITAPDLRMLRALVECGAGWSVIPDYLVVAAVQARRVAAIPAPVSDPTNPFHLVWSKSGLRHPRVAHARDVLLQAWTDQGQTAC